MMHREIHMHEQLMTIVQDVARKRANVVNKADYDYDNKVARIAEANAFVYELDQAFRACSFELGMYIKIVPSSHSLS